MSELKDIFEEELDRLKALRDEFDVQAHLGKAEFKEIWEDVEKKWGHFEAEAERLRKEAEEPLENIGDAAGLLVDEIKAGFQKLRSLI